MQKWAIKLEKIVAYGRIDLADLSEVPPFIRVPLERAAQRNVGDKAASRVARFLIDEAERRSEEWKQIKRSWLRLLAKLGFAWLALLILVWFQVQNIETLTSAYYEAPEPWFIWLGRLRSSLPIWGSLIPLLLIAIFSAWWFRLSQTRQVCWNGWNEEDCSVLTDQLRGVKDATDLSALSHGLLEVESKPTLPNSSAKEMELRSIGESFLTERKRSRRFEWLQARMPAWISFVAMCGLVSAYLGLNLIPMYWMLDRYFRDLRP